MDDLFYETKPGTGDVLFVLRLVFGSAMVVCLVRGVTTIRRRNIAAQDALTWRAEDALTAVAMKQLARFEEWEQALIELSRQLHHWQTQAKATAIRKTLEMEGDDG